MKNKCYYLNIYTCVNCKTLYKNKTKEYPKVENYKCYCGDTVLLYVSLKTPKNRKLKTPKRTIKGVLDLFSDFITIRTKNVVKQSIFNRITYNIKHLTRKIIKCLQKK